MSPPQKRPYWAWTSQAGIEDCGSGSNCGQATMPIVFLVFASIQILHPLFFFYFPNFILLSNTFLINRLTEPRSEPGRRVSGSRSLRA
jgi:hypothetical protein